MDILESLAQHAGQRVEQKKKERPLSEISREALRLPKGDFPFEKALSGEGISFICECKKASPSKGLISAEYPYMKIASDYARGGARAISVLTEPKWFLGSDEHLSRIASAVNLPCLRKDFTVDEYMLYEAKLLGASAVLLICSILESSRLRDYIAICDGLGLSALTEAHDGAEVEEALTAGSRIIGVNNRNLRDFSVDTSTSLRLRESVPGNILFVSESGIKDASDVEAARSMGADAVLVGEALMCAEDRIAKLNELRGTS